MLMALLKLKISHKKSKNSDECGMLAAFDKPINYAVKENLQDLLQYVRLQ